MGGQVAAAFRALMGPDVAVLCDEVELRSGTLLVTTSNPALAHQLRLDAETILVRLNRPDLGAACHAEPRDRSRQRPHEHGASPHGRHGDLPC